MKNGIDVGADSATYTDSTPSDNEIINCFLTSNSPCASPDTASSNSITIIISSSVVPSVTISGNYDTICAGTLVTYAATPVNGGTPPMYQWQVNGNNVLNAGNGNTYSTDSLTNGAIINCILTSNAQCASPLTATSNNDTITVNPSVVPTISISGNNSICAGASANFTATISNGGGAPAYQWQLNGNNVLSGGNANTYSSGSLADGTIVTCILTSNAQCASPSVITSNADTIIINPAVMPAIGQLYIHHY
jgi:hypothetical protein